jgi:hypothetical protein
MCFSTISASCRKGYTVTILIYLILFWVQQLFHDYRHVICIWQPCVGCNSALCEDKKNPDTPYQHYIHIWRGRHRLKFFVFIQSLQTSARIIPATTAWFQICSTSSFIYHPTIRRHMTKSMELRASWEPASRSATLEFPKILCYPKVHYRVHDSPPVVRILRQLNLVHTIPSYLSKIYFNIILPLNSTSS